MSNHWQTIKSRGMLALVAVALAGGTVASARAEDLPPLTSEMAAMKVLRVEGDREMLVDATEAVPGDLLEYQVVYTNNSRRSLRGIEATLPIPVGVAYEPKTATPRSVTASTDQQSFDLIPLRRIQAAADGSKKLIQVPYGEYRALRWKIGTLRAGQSTTVKARARIVSSSAGE